MCDAPNLKNAERSEEKLPSLNPQHNDGRNPRLMTCLKYIACLMTNEEGFLNGQRSYSHKFCEKSRHKLSLVKRAVRSFNLTNDGLDGRCQTCCIVNIVDRQDGGEPIRQTEHVEQWVWRRIAIFVKHTEVRIVVHDSRSLFSHVALDGDGSVVAHVKKIREPFELEMRPIESGSMCWFRAPLQHI